MMCLSTKMITWSILTSPQTQAHSVQPLKGTTDSECQQAAETAPRKSQQENTTTSVQWRASTVSFGESLSTMNDSTLWQVFKQQLNRNRKLRGSHPLKSLQNVLTHR